MNKTDKKAFQSFRASKERITWEQVLQIPILNGTIQLVSDLPVTFIYRFTDEFFIAEIRGEKGNAQWVMPGEIRQIHYDTLEEAERALFEEYREYIVKGNTETLVEEQQPVTPPVVLQQKDWIVNYKWLFLASFTNALGVTKYMYPLTSFGPDYNTAKIFLIIRMKNKNQQLQRIFSAKVLNVHFAYYPDFKDVPEELYKSIPLPQPPKQL